jgi:AMP phosphorylase
MKLKAKLLGMESGGKPIVVLNVEDAQDLGIRSDSRVWLQFAGKERIAIVNLSERAVEEGSIGIFDEVAECLNIQNGSTIVVEVAKFPKSLQHIRNKLKGRRLTEEDLKEIVQDVVDDRLDEIELAAFVTALHTFGISIEEAAGLTNAMVETGQELKLKNGPIVDKHSIGGVPGDKTTLLVVPIVAACGVVIPKTSSRAITSASGTADRAEVLMPVSLGLEEMKTVVRKTNGCIVWGGALHLAPADDKFVQIEYPLSIDPLMMPSIMSKKKSVGADCVVIDLPCGRGSKLKTIGDANLLAKDFIELGKKVGLKVECAITHGEQPIGHTVGPTLEAREVLDAIMRKKAVPDLVDKATHIAGMLLELAGKANGNGQEVAMEAFKSGKAEKKLREIIFEQGGDSEVKSEDIEVGKYGIDVKAERKGYVLWINNSAVTEVARAAGSPKDKTAGVQFYKKVGDPVKVGDRLFTIYADKARKLKRAEQSLKEEPIMDVADRMHMLVHEIKESPVHKKSFILER